MPRSPRLQFTLAAAVVATLVVAEPAQAHPPHETGGLVRDVDMLKSSVTFHRGRIAEQPRDPAHRERLGAVLLDLAKQAGDHTIFREAEAAFRAALALEDRANARFGLAYSLSGQHRFAEAMNEARMVAARTEAAAPVWALMGDLHFAVGNNDEAEALYRMAVEQEVSLQSLVRLAQIEVERGHLDEADRLFHDALDLGSATAGSADVVWLHTIIAGFDLERGDLEGAAAHLEAARAIEPDTPEAQWLTARVEQARGATAAARDRLLHLVAHHPKAAYQRTLADLEDATVVGGTFGFAAARARREAVRDGLLAQVESGDPGHLRELVEIWLETGGDPAAAIAWARQDLVVRQDAGAWETLASALHAAGEHDDAAAAIDEAMVRGAGSARRYWRGARIHAAAGNESRAARLRAHATSINPLLASRPE